MGITEFLRDAVLPAIGVAGILAACLTNQAEEPPVASPKRDALRVIHSVKLVAPADEGLPIARQPEGVYGFTYAPALEAGLFQKHSYLAFEMHKVAGGEVYILGHVSDEHARLLESSGGSFDCEIFPQLYGNARTLVSVPASRIVNAKPLLRDRGNCLRAEIRPSVAK